MQTTHKNSILALATVSIALAGCSKDSSLSVPDFNSLTDEGLKIATTYNNAPDDVKGRINTNWERGVTVSMPVSAISKIEEVGSYSRTENGIPVYDHANYFTIVTKSGEEILLAIMRSNGDAYKTLSGLSKINLDEFTSNLRLGNEGDISTPKNTLTFNGTTKIAAAPYESFGGTFADQVVKFSPTDPLSSNTYGFLSGKKAVITRVEDVNVEQQ